MPRRTQTRQCKTTTAARIPTIVIALILVQSAFPVHAATLFSLVDTGELFSSSDGGMTWSAHAALPVADAVCIGAGASSFELYLVSRSGVVYRSDDAGAAWDAVGSVAADDVADMGIRGDGVVLLLTESGTVYASADMGVSFAPQAALTGSDFTALETAGEDTVYALGAGGGVSRSIDGGTSWAAAGVITVPDAADLVVMGSNLYAVSGTGWVHRSSDGGADWTAVGTLSQVHTVALATDGTELYAATLEGEIAGSVDGFDWEWRGSVNQMRLTALGTDVPAVTGVGEPPFGHVALSLGQNYPNPLSHRAGVTYLPFTLERRGFVELNVYDAVGRLVRRLVAEDLSARSYRVPWDGADEKGIPVASGVYCCELKCRGIAAFGKIAVVR
jgi:hypothetical protein